MAEAAEATGSVQIERINDAILCTFSNGATLWFDSKTDAGLFAANLSMVCAFGGDTLDGAEVRDFRKPA